MSTDNLGLGRLTRVDPRTVWKNEARDLTPWLLENIETLAEALGTEIIPAEREVRVGQFLLDVLGEDSSGRPVIVENQLEPTDHTHLGQLLVYASGLEAAIVIWLTPSFREEHRRALDWLNERTDDSVYFFGVELDLVKIGDSPAAPVFRVVARPNDWQRAVKRQTGAISEAAIQRNGFFESVLEDIALAQPTFRKPKVGHDNWVSMASGPFGYYALSFCTGNRVRAEIYLDTGERESTKQLFDNLQTDRSRIEAEYGGELEWERLEPRRASRIAAYRPAPELLDEVATAEARTWSSHALRQLMLLDGRLRSAAQDARNSTGAWQAAPAQTDAMP